MESAHKTYIHMKVEVNIELPVIAGFWWINSSGEEQWASIKYERLFEFCYGCRRLGHTSQVCREEVTISKVIYEHPMYGSWMTGTKPKPYRESRSGGGIEGEQPQIAKARAKNMGRSYETSSGEGKEDNIYERCM